MARLEKDDFVRQVSEFSLPHHDDLPSADTMTQEMSIWFEKYAKNKESDQDIDSLAKAYVAAENSINFPNITYILKVLLTIPATSAGSERANSTLKFIKTRLRSTMSQFALNTFVLGYKHKDFLHSMSLADLCTTFISMKKRRLLLLNPISE